MKRINRLEKQNNENTHSAISSRKSKRKAKLKEKKIKRAVHYAKQHHTEKVCIKKEDLERVSKLNKNTNLHSLLEGKILSNSSKKYEIPTNHTKKKKKNKAKADNQKQSNGKLQDTDSESESFKVVNGITERMARLQAFVDQEAKHQSQSDHKVEKDGDNESKNLIKDKKKLRELREGQEADSKELNKLARSLVFNKHLKEKVCKEYDTEFGDLIRDIEQGTMSDTKEYDSRIHSDDDDDNCLERDLNMALGKELTGSRDNPISLGDSPKNSSQGEDNVVIINDSATNSELEDSEGLITSDGGASTEDCDFSSEEMNDTNENAYDFFDEEAEEGNETEEEDDDDPEKNENYETLLFEGGGSVASGSKSMSSDVWSYESESIFDAYSTSSEDSDLDGFVVDDNYVEFDTDKSSFSENTSDSSPEKQRHKRKSDPNTDSNNNRSSKRRRILTISSESSVEDLTKLEVSPKDDLTLKGILKSTSANEQERNHSKRVSFNPVEQTSEQSTNTVEEGPEENGFHEDIYGRIRDKKGNIVEPEQESPCGKYIPPAQRKLMALNQSSEKKELLLILHKKLKGLLNRLAESNMPGIAKQIEGMYKEYSRNDMNETLTKLLFESIVTSVMTPDRLVQDHACLIASLSANVGPEVGGHIFTEFVVQFIEGLNSYKPSSDQQLDSKELDNLLHTIVHLYNFRVVDSCVIYDILNKLLEKFCEKEVELILLVLRSVGFALRKSDPLALKQFILNAQSKAATASNNQKEAFTRVRFMLEILTAIKNNNMTKVPNYDPTYGEHLRSVMKSIVRQGCSPSNLKVSLTDILKSKVIGKWWIVGSAWSGGLKENQETSPTPAITPLNPLCDSSIYSDKFNQKATKLRLSRPPRLNIFYCLTEGSEGCLDSFEKLLMLRLPRNQEQEIFNVMLICSIRGIIYNQFYSNLAIKLCSYHKRFKRLLTLALWDKFKELASLKPSRLSNLARFVAEVVAEKAITLSVFKKLDLLHTNTTLVSFLRQSLICLLLHPTGATYVSDAFVNLYSSPNFKFLRQALRLFILHFMRPKDIKEQNVDLHLLSIRTQMVLDILETGKGFSL